MVGDLGFKYMPMIDFSDQFIDNWLKSGIFGGESGLRTAS